MRMVLKGTKERTVNFKLHPEICRYLKERNRDRIMGKIFRKRIVFEEDENLDKEEVKFNS